MWEKVLTGQTGPHTHTHTNFIVYSNVLYRYKMLSDPAGWLEVSQESGFIRLRNVMDREDALVKDGQYTALILAYDDGEYTVIVTDTNT